MAYTSGMLHDEIFVQNRSEAQMGDFGVDSDGIGWVQNPNPFPCNVSWQKGTAGMREGALDAYGIIIVRMRWTDLITMRSRIVFDGHTYQILPETFHPYYQENTLQFLAQIIINEI